MSVRRKLLSFMMITSSDTMASAMVGVRQCNVKVADDNMHAVQSDFRMPTSSAVCQHERKHRRPNFGMQVCNKCV
jgi:hypothetical protein